MRHSVVIGVLTAVVALANLLVGQAAHAAAPAAAGQAAGGWYAELPDSLRVCDNAPWRGGPSSAPSGAIVVPAGNNKGFDFGQTGKTYWFAPGIHDLGEGEYSQIFPGSDSVY